MPERTDEEKKVKGLLGGGNGKEGHDENPAFRCPRFHRNRRQRAEFAQQRKQWKMYCWVFIAMSYRSWLLFAALGIALPSNSWGQTATQDEPWQQAGAADTNQHSEGQDEQTVSLLPALEGIEAAIRELIAVEDHIDAQRQQDAENRDLLAQEEMAKWSFWMTLATLGGVAATFVGLALIGRTLHHTRRAADYTGAMLLEAGKATRAAEEAVTATRDIGEKQVRAYLHVKDFRFNLGAKQGQFGVSLSVANAGQSPAVNTRGSVAFRGIAAEPILIEVSLPNIAANSETTRYTDQFRMPGLHGARRITAYIIVTAEDVFGHDIKSVSMRTIMIPCGAKAGQVYEPEDAEGLFPDDAVEFFGSDQCRLVPSEAKSGAED